MTIPENNKLGRFFIDPDKALKEVYDNLNLMKDPIHEIYKSSISRELLIDASDDNKYDIEYEQSPYSFLLVVPPDCTRIDDDDHCSNTIKSISPQIRQMLVHDYYPKLTNGPITINPRKPFTAKEYRKHFGPRHRNTSIPILTNFYIRDSVSVTDISINTLDYGQNRSGGRQIIGTNILRSQVGNQVSISYAEISSNQYGPAIITNLHRAWLQYMQEVFLGEMSPGPKYTFCRPTLKELILLGEKLSVNNNTEKLTMFTPLKQLFADQPITGVINTSYRKFANHQRRTLNYLGGIYFFKLKPDGRTISYWCRWTGVFPTAINTSSNFSSGKNDNPVVDVTYQSQFFEENEIDLLVEFNLTQLDEQVENLVSERLTWMFQTPDESTISASNKNSKNKISANVLKGKNVSIVLKHSKMEVYKLFVGASEIDEAIELLSEGEYEVVTKLTLMRNSFITTDYKSELYSTEKLMIDIASLFSGRITRSDDYEANTDSADAMEKIHKKQKGSANTKSIDSSIDADRMKANEELKQFFGSFPRNGSATIDDMLSEDGKELWGDVKDGSTKTIQQQLDMLIKVNEQYSKSEMQFAKETKFYEITGYFWDDCLIEETHIDKNTGEIVGFKFKTRAEIATDNKNKKLEAQAAAHDKKVNATIDEKKSEILLNAKTGMF